VKNPAFHSEPYKELSSTSTEDSQESHYCHWELNQYGIPIAISKKQWAHDLIQAQPFF